MTWFTTEELSSETDLGGFFLSSIGRWHCVTGHNSEIPAEVMSASLHHVLLLRAVKTCGHIFTGLSGHRHLHHPKHLSSQMHENMCTCIVHLSAQWCHIYSIFSCHKQIMNIQWHHSVIYIHRHPTEKWKYLLFTIYRVVCGCFSTHAAVCE